MWRGLPFVLGFLATAPSPSVNPDFRNIAQEAGLDMERFRKDIASGKYETHIERDINDGQQAGVQGTPTLFVNGKRYNGPISEAALKPILAAELKSSGQVAQAR